MKSFFLFLTALLLSFTITAQSWTAKPGFTMGVGVGGYYEWLPATYNGTNKLPVIIAFHGAGEQGNGTSQLVNLLNSSIPQQINNGGSPTYPYEAIVICPQYSGWIGGFTITNVINYVRANYSVDTNRIHLTGLSMGGGVIMDFGEQGDLYKVATIVPVCPASGYASAFAARLAYYNRLYYLFHATDDDVVPYSYSTSWVNGLNTLGISPPAQLYTFPSTNYPTISGHNIWSTVYDYGFIAAPGINIHQWMLMRKKSGTSVVTIQFPVANAGNDQVINLPTNTINLTGSATDADGTISSYRWEKVAGPAGGTITSPNSSSTSVTSLQQGTYRYQLRAMDNEFNINIDEIEVVVNASGNATPIVNAGDDFTIVLPSNSTSLTATASDPDGTIASYSWVKIIGPTGGLITSPSAGTTGITGLTQGSYTYRVTVTDNLGATATDEVQVNVIPGSNIPPVANAGTDQTLSLPLTQFTLTGSGTDVDGTVGGYLWTKISGPAGGVISSPTSATTLITSPNVGVYTYRLQVTDNGNATSTDDVQITINPGTGATYKIPVLRDNIYNLNALVMKDAWRLFDGNLSTKIDAVADSFDVRSFPYSTFVALDSIYNLSTVRYRVGISYGGHKLSLQFYDNSFTAIGDTVLMNIAGNNLWYTLSVNRANIRYVEVRGWTNGDVNDNLMEVELIGTAASAAASITPSFVTINSVSDHGVYGNGINTWGERLYRITSAGDTILPRLGKSARIMYAGSDFDIFSQTYNSRLINGPFNLGRYGFNHLGNALSNLSRWGMTSVIGKTGGSIKWLGAGAANNNNNSLRSFTDAQYRQYIETTANPVIDTSWNGLAEQFYTMIALYGSNAVANITGKVILNGSTTLGQNTAGIFEWNNDHNLWWNSNYYISPEAYYIGMKNIYTRGKQADPNAKIYAPAVFGADTLFWKAVYFHHYRLSGLTSVPFDGIMFNSYLNDSRGISHYGTVGLSPEQYNLTTRLQELKTFMNRFFPNKPVIWSGYGYATADNSKYDVNSIGSKNERQVQADWTLRVKAIAETQRIVEKMYYNSIVEDTNPDYATMNAVTDIAPGGVYSYSTIEPVGFALSQQSYVERNYKFFSTINTNGDSTGTWITVKDHVSDANRKLYKIWRGSRNESTQLLNLTIPNATSAKLYTLKYDSFFPDSSLLVVTSNQLSVTATEGISWVEVALNGANYPPFVTPGPNQTINIPTTVATISSVASDADGFIASYFWEKISGPATGTIVSSSLPTTVINGLNLAGTYVFRVTVTDNLGATSTATVSVIVNGVNQVPVVSAGPDQTITLPLSSVTMNGSASDADGTISTRLWSKVSGPAGGVISSPGSNVTQISGLGNVGTYTFRFTVTDNVGAISFDDVTITVLQQGFVGVPTVNANTKATVNTSTKMRAYANDSDGTIAAYLWTQVSGPATVSFSPNNTVETTVSGLTTNGVYVIRIRVTDNLGNQASKDVHLVKTSKYTLIK
jgi:hypothetical protein